jgi:hypothetical protein
MTNNHRLIRNFLDNMVATCIQKAAHRILILMEYDTITSTSFNANFNESKPDTKIN